VLTSNLLLRLLSISALVTPSCLPGSTKIDPSHAYHHHHLGRRHPLKFDVVFPIVLTPMFRTSGLNSKMQIIFNYPH
jgi:hypothetical protein